MPFNKSDLVAKEYPELVNEYEQFKKLEEDNHVALERAVWWMKSGQKAAGIQLLVAIQNEILRSGELKSARLILPLLEQMRAPYEGTDGDFSEIPD